MTFPEEFGDLSDLDVVLHGLGLSKPHLDCIIIVSDVEANERNAAQILEWGSVTINTTNQNFRSGSHGAAFLLDADVRHIRVTENAHIVNKRWCKGCPEAFECGHSQFSTYDQLVLYVKELLTPRDDRGKLRPVLYVAHDAHKESETLLDLLGDEYSTFMSNVQILDTQCMAKQLGFGSQIGLRNLLPHFGLMSSNPHNAGNDALYTAGAMIGMAMQQYNASLTPDEPSLGSLSLSESEELSEVSTAPTDLSPAGASTTLQDAIHIMAKKAKQHPPAPVHGSYVYCPICASTEHDREDCGYKYHRCSRCYFGGHIESTRHVPQGRLEVSPSAPKAALEKRGKPLVQCTACAKFGHQARICQEKDLERAKYGRKGQVAEGFSGGHRRVRNNDAVSKGHASSGVLRREGSNVRDQDSWW